MVKPLAFKASIFIGVKNKIVFQVMKKASVVVSSGDAIAIFREIKSLSPHGRYEIKVSL
jgi:hypothetical protein